MFARRGERKYREILDGVKIRSLVNGEKSLMVEFLLEKGRELPRHAHPYEQTGYLITGSMRLFIGDRVHHVNPGDSWCIPKDVEHGAEVIEETLLVEVFSPPREDYLPGNLHSA